MVPTDVRRPRRHRRLTLLLSAVALGLFVDAPARATTWTPTAWARAAGPATYGFTFPDADGYTTFVSEGDHVVTASVGEPGDHTSEDPAQIAATPGVGGVLTGAGASGTGRALVSYAAGGGEVKLAERTTTFGTWSDPVSISTYGGNESLAIDAAGNAVVVYSDKTEGLNRLRARHRPAGGSWSVPETLVSTASPYLIRSAVGMDASGTATAIWEDPDTGVLRTARHVASVGPWSAPADVAAAPDGTAGDEFSLVVAADGTATAAWESPTHDTVRVARRAVADASFATPAGFSIADRLVDQPRLAGDAADDLVLGVLVRDPLNPGVEVAAATRPAAGSWSSLQSLGTATGFPPLAAVAPDGAAMLVWGTPGGSGGLTTAIHPSGGAWSSPEAFSSGPLFPGYAVVSGYASLAAAGPGRFALQYKLSSPFGLGWRTAFSTVAAGPQPALMIPAVRIVGTPLEFDARASSDPDGTVTPWRWDWDGDRVYDDTTAGGLTTHTYTSRFYGTVRLRTVDDDANTYAHRERYLTVWAETYLDSGPPSTTADPTPTFTFHASDGEPLHDCHVDMTYVSDCTSPYTPSTPLEPGEHTFGVRSAGPSLISDPTEATTTFTVEGPPTPDPTPTPTPGPGTTTTTGSPAATPMPTTTTGGTGGTRPAPTPTPSPVATPPRAVAFTTIVTLPRALRRCASRRRFPLRFRAPKGRRVTAATMTIDGRAAPARTAGATLDLRRLRRKTVRVVITLRLDDGSAVRSTRRFRTCTARRA